MPGRPLGGKSSMRGRWQQLFIASDLNLFMFPLFQLQGGGLYLAQTSSATITSSTISGNSAVSDFEMRVPVCEVAGASRQVIDGSCVLIFCAGVCVCAVGCWSSILYVGSTVVRLGWMEWVPWQGVSIVCMT